MASWAFITSSDRRDSSAGIAPWLPSAISLIILLIASSILFSVFPHLPSADDEIFYFDAGYALATGTYSPPSANHPFHHYLRWPVILPLSVWFRLLDASEFSYWLSAVAPHLACMVLVFAFIKSLNGSTIPSLAAAGSVPLLSFHLLQPRVLSEAPVAVLSLLTLLLVERARRSPTVFAWGLAGLAQACALSASLVALFYIPGTLCFALFRSYQHQSLRLPPAGLVAAFMFGLLAGMTTLSFLEFLVSGDFLLQLRVIQHWHLKTIAPTSSWLTGLFNMADPDRRLGGFILSYPYLMPWLTGAALCAGAAGALSKGPRTTQSPALIIAIIALVSLFTLELFGPLAISKTYVRFTAFPVMLVIAGSVYAAVSGIGDHRWAHRLMWTPTVAFCLIQGWENLSLLNNRPCASPYVSAVTLVRHDVEARLGPHWKDKQDFKLVNLEGHLPGLAPFVPAARAYTHFQIDASTIEFELSSLEEAGLKYVILPHLEAENFSNGSNVRRLDYPNACGLPRPAVFAIHQHHQE